MNKDQVYQAASIWTQCFDTSWWKWL